MFVVIRFLCVENVNGAWLAVDPKMTVLQTVVRWTSKLLVFLWLFTLQAKCGIKLDSNTYVWTNFVQTRGCWCPTGRAWTAHDKTLGSFLLLLHKWKMPSWKIVENPQWMQVYMRERHRTKWRIVNMEVILHDFLIEIPTCQVFPSCVSVPKGHWFLWTARCPASGGDLWNPGPGGELLRFGFQFSNQCYHKGSSIVQ